jgi:hypothetical protein
MNMKRTRLFVFVAAAGVLTLAPSASASANETNGACVAQFTSSQEAGEVGATVSFLAHEAQPFGTNVVAFSPGLKPPCE